MDKTDLLSYIEEISEKISEISDFQLKTKRYVVPGIPVNAIVLKE